MIDVVINTNWPLSLSAIRLNLGTAFMTLAQSLSQTSKGSFGFMVVGQSRIFGRNLANGSYTLNQKQMWKILREKSSVKRNCHHHRGWNSPLTYCPVRASHKSPGRGRRPNNRQWTSDKDKIRYKDQWGQISDSVRVFWSAWKSKSVLTNIPSN